MIQPVSFRRIFQPISLAVACLSWLTGCAQSQPAPVAAAEKIRVMTYNIRHGRGLDNQVNLERIAKLIKEEGPDIVALQEVDKGTERTERRDLAAELAALTGMTAVFSNNYHFQGGEYGNAVLTRFPVRHWTNQHYRMLRPGEQRGIIQLTLDIHGRELVFMSTHIDYRADDSERWANVGEIETILQRHPKTPIIMCGDFNDTPESRVYRRLSENLIDVWQRVGEGPGLTIPPVNPRKRIDYIWLSKGGAIEPLRVWVPQTEASDHLPVVAELKLK
ncbi:MAG TPA: endonuclease/exonuclease/phosphatase family protein [Verrucomicrobiae bacterium]|nr:endonuclease/exonuclease/phosphatase family protein [Verrucomicrobiae bacterium]